jgi:hypothetical protein
MSRRGNQVGNREGAVSPRWLFLLGLASGCSEQVSSVTTASSLLPDAPTSPYASASDGSNDQLADAAADHETSADPTATSFGDRTGEDAITGEGDGSEVADGGFSPGEATHATTDGGLKTNVVDGHLPELSPLEDANTCGIPIGNGPPLCDPVANCGCESEQTCAFTPDRLRLFTCVSPGNITDGARCDADDGCTKGSVCANGLCAATCRLDADCGGDKCAAVPTSEGVVENLRVCVSPCDPLDPAACGDGATCANAPGTATFSCVRQGNLGSADTPCTASSDCAPGLGCALDGVCRSWCSLEPSDDDAADAGPSTGDVTTSGASVCPEYSECLAFDPQDGLGLCGASCPVPDVVGSECSIIPATCGCSDGETCQVEISGKTQCAPPGDHTTMQWCSRNADCAAGLSCVGGLCRPVCDAELLPCADGSGCVEASSATNSPSTCLGHCDPVLTDLDDDEFTPCGVGAYCAPGLPNDAVLAESYCTRQSDTPAKEDAACTADYQCKNGFGCDPTSDTCQPWCREAEDCATGEACDLTVSRAAGSADPVGICR